MKRWRNLKKLGGLGLIVGCGMLGGWVSSADWPEPWETLWVILCLWTASLITRYLAKRHGAR